MDTSKEYILMCEKAEEIQKTWRPWRGDIVGRKACSPWKPKDGFSYDCMIVTAWGDNHLEDINDPKVTTVLIYYMRNHTGWSSLYLNSIKSGQNSYLDMMRAGKDMCFYEIERKDLRWLPRQDQLQGMVDKKAREMVAAIKTTTLPYLLTQKFYYAVCGGPVSYGPGFTSMEQLWLAFVMKMKYKKTWDGENWIKKG